MADVEYLCSFLEKYIVWQISNSLMEFTRPCFLLPQKRVVWWDTVRSAIVVILNVNSEHFAKQGWPNLSRGKKKFAFMLFPYLSSSHLCIVKLSPGQFASKHPTLSWDLSFCPSMSFIHVKLDGSVSQNSKTMSTRSLGKSRNRCFFSHECKQEFNMHLNPLHCHY